MIKKDKICKDTSRVIVVEVVLKSISSSADDISNISFSESRLHEAVGLAQAIDLQVVRSFVVAVSRPSPATLIRKGKIKEINTIIHDLDVGLIIIDQSLTPVQQRNLEKIWNIKVIDRIGLILEIFGRRALTKEGALQVELAHLNYQKGRLVRSWTHLERQRGGTGFLGGPGETQIEADRRMLQQKICYLEQQLEKVVRTRQLHRAKRKKVPYPIIALVGYTNAGKSTLFNRITGSSVFVENMLFSTLDPTLRRIILPHGPVAFLADTVGFISDLPTHLVAAFRATLEEVRQADVILHVRDISNRNNAAQARDVYTILSDLDIDVMEDCGRILEVWNKVDCLEPHFRKEIFQEAASQGAIPVSSITGDGFNVLASEITRRLSGKTVTENIVLSVNQLSFLPWIYQHAQVKRRNDMENGSIHLNISIAHAELIGLEKLLSSHVVD
ncbi:GTPase HflX [Liberibacter crescens]|uniref:GTPase HflX n=1 Tax=Liberibacter crescens TaxID=1273132 RepID=UPI003CC6F265